MKVLLMAVLLAVIATPVAAQELIVSDPTFNVPAGDDVRGAGDMLITKVVNGLQDDAHCADVMTQSGFRDLAQLQRLRAVLGSDAGLTQLAGQLAAAAGGGSMVTVSIGRVGGTYLVDLSAASGDSVSHRAEGRADSLDGLYDATRTAAATLGREVGCGNAPLPTPLGFDGTITYDITLAYHNTNGTSTLDTTSHRTDAIVLKPLGLSTDHVVFEEDSHIHVWQPATPTVCPMKEWKEFPAGSDQHTVETTKGSGDPRPSVDVEAQNGALHVSLSVPDFLPRQHTETEDGTSFGCGEQFPPSHTTSTSTAVSTQVDGASADVDVPFDSTKGTQTGTKSWPVEVSGFKGKATLTWSLTGH